MYKDNNSLIWLVDKDGQIFNGNFGNWSHITTKMDGGNKTILIDNNDVWVGGYASGVSKFDGERWTDYDGVV